MTMELGGKVTIECEKNNLRAELDFKLKVMCQIAGDSAWSSCREGWSPHSAAGEVPQTSTPEVEFFASPQDNVLRERKWLPTGHIHSKASKSKSHCPDGGGLYRSESVLRHWSEGIFFSQS